MRTRNGSTFLLALCIVGTIIFAIGLSGLVPMIVVRTGSVIFGLGLAMLGFGLWRGSRESS